MRILRLHYYGYFGGAGGTASVRRLQIGLRKAGVDSRMLCKVKNADLPEIVQLPQRRLYRKFQPKLDKLGMWVGLRGLMIPGTLAELLRSDEYKAADLIHIHRIYDYISYLSLPRITRDKPTVLTLHDTWAFTGHCYVSMQCEKWRTGCGGCPHLDIFPKIKFDNTRLEWKLKNWAYKRSNLTIIAISKSIKKMVEKSMLGHCDVRYIPNGLETGVYIPHDSQQCRKMLQIPQGKRVLLASTHAFGNFNKGRDLLIKSLRLLPEGLKSKTVLLMFGAAGESVTPHLDMQYMDLGYISSDAIKAIAYAAADLFLFPTRGEALPRVALESISCGTPVVSFKVKGVSDIVRPGITGDSAEPEDVEGFAARITALIQDDERRERMRKECREIAVNEYDVEVIVQKHIDLYNEILARSHA
jgi:glycosyltransferase involved in cell wall biosynthesis